MQRDPGRHVLFAREGGYSRNSETWESRCVGGTGTEVVEQCLLVSNGDIGGCWAATEAWAGNEQQHGCVLGLC